MRISDWSSDVCSSDLADQEAACVRGCMACIHLTEQHAGPNGEQLCKQIVGGECVPDSAPEGSVDMTLLFQHFGQDAVLLQKAEQFSCHGCAKGQNASISHDNPFIVRAGMADQPVGARHS